MHASAGDPIVGGCQCGTLRFALQAPPLFTHACHCLVCRRRSGSAFGLTTTVLRAELAVTSGTLATKPTSPRTTLFRCAACDTTMWAESTRFPVTAIVRGGTFDDPVVATPGAHIWVRRKHPWVVLPDGIPQYKGDLDIEQAWPQASLDRLHAAEAALLQARAP